MAKTVVMKDWYTQVSSPGSQPFRRSMTGNFHQVIRMNDGGKSVTAIEIEGKKEGQEIQLSVIIGDQRFEVRATESDFKEEDEQTQTAS